MTVVIGGAFLNTDGYPLIDLEAMNLGKTAAALGVRIKGALLPSQLKADTQVLIRGLYAEGHGKRALQVQLTDTDPPPDVNRIYKSTAYGKVVCSNIGQHRVAPPVDIGEASETEARAAARQIVQAGLDLAAERTIRVNGKTLDTVPERGKVCKFLGVNGASWTGTVIDVHESGGGQSPEMFDIRAINYNATTYQP